MFQIENKLTETLGTIYPTLHEPSAFLVMQLTAIIRDVPRQHLVSIIKSYLQQSDSLSQKKRLVSFKSINICSRFDHNVHSI